MFVWMNLSIYYTIFKHKFVEKKFFDMKSHKIILFYQKVLTWTFLSKFVALTKTKNKCQFEKIIVKKIFTKKKYISIYKFLIKFKNLRIEIVYNYYNFINAKYK